MRIEESINQRIRLFEIEDEFSPEHFYIQEDEIFIFGRMRRNPQRFLPKIFHGNAVDVASHPAPGGIRLLRIMPDEEGVLRAIFRQGSKLFVYPSH